MTFSIPPEYDPGYGLKPEFGEMARNTGRVLNAEYDVQMTRSRNLLTKAVRALRAGDTERADRLVERAAQMPYNDREEESAGVGAARVVAYSVISDEFEASEQDDPVWLDVVLRVFPGLDDVGQAHVASTVHGFVRQGAVFVVTPGESRRIRRAFGDAPLDADLGEDSTTTGEGRRAIISSLVAAAAQLETAFQASRMPGPVAPGASG